MLTNEQLTMLINSYGLEQILLDYDIEQEYVLKLLIEQEGLLNDLEEDNFNIEDRLGDHSGEE